MNQEEDKLISFHSEDINFELSFAPLLSDWIQHVIRIHHQNLVNLNFIFCSDSYLHRINLEYLQHDTLTDVITFPMSAAPEIEGDIFISIERIEENATQFGVPFDEELHRVMIHGVLHLCGFLDKTEADKKLMTQKENESLLLLNSLKKQAD